MKQKNRKALIITTVSGFVPQFEMNNVHILQELGYEVHYASNFNNPSYGNDNSRLDGTGIICHQIDMERSPFRLGELHRAYGQLKTLMRETHFELIHCHTPVGGALGRLAAKAVRDSGKTDFHTRNSTYNLEKSFIIYTAHGFHFYRGARLINWLLYYPAERWLARYTDVLITINREDYERARRFCRGKNTQVERIVGAGADISYFRGDFLPEGRREEIRRKMRERLHIKEGELVFLSVGELIPRKNHSMAIQAFAKLEKENLMLRRRNGGGTSSGYRYLICGQGALKKKLQRRIDRAGLAGKVQLAGFRRNIRGMLYASDIFVFPSRQEGMPVAMIEAAAAGLPIISSDIRGNREVAESFGKVCSFAGKKELKQRLKEALVCRFSGRSAGGSSGGDSGKPEEEDRIAKKRCRIKENRTGREMDQFDMRQVGRRMREIYLRPQAECSAQGRRE